jgi:hypothetical protein
MKPRLKYLHESRFWLCFVNGKDGIGLAYTPKEAFLSWYTMMIDKELE